MRFGVGAACGVLLLASCVDGPAVVRLVDGRTVAGRFVAPQSYELFLRAELALESGDHRYAIAAFETLAAQEPDDALVWSRLASARCHENVHDARISVALTRARALEGSLGVVDPGIAACEARGASGQIGASSDRDRLVALALAAPSAASYRALHAWASAYDDEGLEAYAAQRLARRSSKDALALSERALSLAASGRHGLARVIAAASVDSSAQPLPIFPVQVVCLAVDEALSRGDEAQATLRAERGQLSLVDVAARAVAMGNYPIGRRVAAVVVAADPGNLDARMVLIAAGAAMSEPVAFGKLNLEPGASATVAGLAARLVYARALVRVAPDAVSSLPRVPLSNQLDAADALLVPIALALASVGIVDPSELPASLRVRVSDTVRAP